MRRRSRSEASRWRSSAISSARGIYFAAPPGLSDRGRPSPARATLEEHGDRANAAHARVIEVRRLVLVGRLDEAERVLARFDPRPLPPASRTAHELVVAGIAVRRLRTQEA